jgi:hypothetical protein
MEVEVRFPDEDNVKQIVRAILETTKNPSPKVIESRIRASMNKSIIITIKPLGV